MKAEDFDFIKRVYAEINLDAVINNIANMKKVINDDTKIVAVIKTNGYGHGSIPISCELEQLDYVWGYAVATVEEAISLREAGIKKAILILGYTFPYSFSQIVENDIRPAVFRPDALEELNETGRRAGRKISVHIKVDTGMGRIGITPDDAGIEFVKKAIGCEYISVEGIFTHFPKADEADKTYTHEQIARFEAFVNRIKCELGVDIPLVHCSNSAGIIEFKSANYNMVRAGITLYGLQPSDEVDMNSIQVEPVMQLKSHIVFLKTVEDKTPISYGGTYLADGKRLIATVPVGYGDGYSRMLSGKGEVLIRGKRAPICGRVCMDQIMVDVTDIDGVMNDDVVTLIGTDGNETITMEEVGSLSGRFNYEFACDINLRVPRVYVKDGNVTDIILDGKSIK